MRLCGGAEKVVNKIIADGMRKYDIFISCKSEDYAKAEPIYHWLVEQGYNPFFAAISRQTGTTIATGAVVGEIDEILDQVDNMIVFVSKANYAQSRWVKREWELFVGEQLAGRKQGNIVTILDGVLVKDLPAVTLRNMKSFTIDTYKNGLLRYMRKTGQEEIELSKEQNETELSKEKEPNVQESLLFTIKGGVKFKMVKVLGGQFEMGATEEQGDDAFEDEKPAHKVTLSDYYIGETEVTQGLWKAIMGGNPSVYKNNNDDILPVENVSWEDVTKKFIPKLNKQTRRKFRLPTEAEWEYAARGGNQQKDNEYKYSGNGDINKVAWYGATFFGETHPVRQKESNLLGLYDMSGNVWEWCSDWFGSYNDREEINPKGPENGTERVIRGGSYFNYDWRCRVSYRGKETPSTESMRIGFRLVLSS